MSCPWCSHALSCVFVTQQSAKCTAREIVIKVCTELLWAIREQSLFHSFGRLFRLSVRTHLTTRNGWTRVFSYLAVFTEIWQRVPLFLVKFGQHLTAACISARRSGFNLQGCLGYRGRPCQRAISDERKRVGISDALKIKNKNPVLEMFPCESHKSESFLSRLDRPNVD